VRYPTGELFPLNCILYTIYGVGADEILLRQFPETMEPQLDQTVPQVEMKTREEAVAGALRLAIIRGAFRPGEKLDLGALSDRLGVSRSPIREALRTLAAEELITIVPHRGVMVKERTADELEQLFFIRATLEGAAARRAAAAMTDERLEAIETILVAGEKSYDMEEVLGLNNDFHTLIYSSFHQPILIATIQQFRNRMGPYNRLYLDSEGSKDAAWADHRRIFEACKARDEKRCERETIKHLEQVFKVMQTAVTAS